MLRRELGYLGGACLTHTCVCLGLRESGAKERAGAELKCAAHLALWPKTCEGWTRQATEPCGPSERVGGSKTPMHFCPCSGSAHLSDLLHTQTVALSFRAFGRGFAWGEAGLRAGLSIRTLS